MKKAFLFLLAIGFAWFSLACPIPGNLQTVELNRTSARITWQTVQGQMFQLALVQNGQAQVVYTGFESTFFLEGLEMGTSYGVKVRQICGNDTGAYSQELLFQTLSGSYVYLDGGLIKAASYDYGHLPFNRRAQLLNINNKPLSASQTTGFWQRAQHDINHYRTTSNFGTTFFESEKASYPTAMYSLMFGVAQNDSAYIRPSRDYLEFLSIYDVGSDLTDLVDLFPAFTLKGQIPKYYYFGKRHGGLRANYLNRMRNAFRLWTHDTTNLPRDPLGRPNPYFQSSMAGQCWSVRCRNTWVDGRNTDNLKAMRESSVYLFAHEINNETVANTYTGRIRNHASALFHVGYSEWDSENYYSHSVSPWLNLYTFAEDAEIKRTAKGAVDWYLACGAIKYFKGMFAGPTKRLNESANVPFLGVAPLPLYLYFGDTSITPTENDRDGYISMISHYRPAQAFGELTNKQFAKPVELINTKPVYGSFNPTSSTSPEVWETLYIGNTYQFGTCVSAGASGDTRAFKLAAENNQGTSDVFFANTTTNNTLFHAKRTGDQIGQYRNIAIYLCRAGQNKFLFQAPAATSATFTGETWFFEYAKTWVAVKPIGIDFEQIVPLSGSYANHNLYLANNNGSLNFTGFAMEVGELGQYASFDAFRTQVLNNSILDLSGIAQSRVTYTDARGAFLEMTYNNNNDLPMLKRNSTANHSFRVAGNYEIYRPITPPSVNILRFTNQNGIPELVVHAKDSIRGPIAQDWKTGTLRVTTDNHVFIGKMTQQGQYSWQELAATPALKKGAIASIELLLGNTVIYTLTDSLRINANETFLSLQSLGVGTFTLQARVTDEEGNETTSLPFEVTISVTGIINQQESVLVYPNPVEHGELIVENAHPNTLIRLFTIDGKQIKQWKIEQSLERLVVNVHPGLHLLSTTRPGQKPRYQKLLIK